MACSCGGGRCSMIRRAMPPTPPCGCRPPIHSLVDTVIQELRNSRSRSRKVVRSASASKLALTSSGELLEDKLVNRALEKGLLLEFKKDSEKVFLAVAQRPDGKKNWMVLDQNGFTSSIKLNAEVNLVSLKKMILPCWSLRGQNFLNRRSPLCHRNWQR
ncbi:hypothetical protein MLD38_024944 [Melastoma candidum]|uniref:Uncharacterized protein n=1 Tax=Melastoma candidum TaxID=119954 RepID=A0ACB9NUT4_9MYRT|nr:hypothetical protein MLD38_024944 [Melastoma candidum]